MEEAWSMSKIEWIWKEMNRSLVCGTKFMPSHHFFSYFWGKIEFSISKSSRICGMWKVKPHTNALGIGWLICACASCSVFEHADCKVL
jgi:hypothetical protein